MNKTLVKVLRYIEDAIKLYPIKEEGKKHQDNVHYMNANDGTDFDWSFNEHTCEFTLFYDSGEKSLGYITARVFKDGYIRGYVWDTERYNNGVEIAPQFIGKGVAKAFKGWLNTNFDKLNKWDKPIAKLSDLPPVVLPKPKYNIFLRVKEVVGDKQYTRKVKRVGSGWDFNSYAEEFITTSPKVALETFNQVVNSIKEQFKINFKVAHNIDILHKVNKGDIWEVICEDDNHREVYKTTL